MVFHSVEELIQRLRAGDRPVVFLVGSALTMPSPPGGPGVCNVDAVVQLITDCVATPRGTGFTAKQAARSAAGSLAQALTKAGEGGSRYQVGFDQLKTLVGPEAVNAVIRQAVLKARTVPTTVDLADAGALAQLETSPAGWHLGPGVKALGLLAARHRRRFGRAVLTTNFDPLIEVAIRAAGGQAFAFEQIGDGTLSAADPLVTSVVHVHGLWRGDSLHTPGALTVDRAALRSSLVGLFKEVTLVVMGYGGWDDVLTEALAEVAVDARARVDVLWCFFQKEADIRQRFPHLLELFVKFRERLVVFAGVDCNKALPRLREAVDEEFELLGRETVCEQLFEAIDRGHAVEIVGELHMKRSDLLTWVKRDSLHKGKIALINGRELATATAEALVRKVAAAVGKGDEMQVEIHRLRAVPNDEDAIRSLRLLDGVWILIDDADALARAGHGFSEAFFAELRKKVQDREIHWVSVAKAPLGVLFQGFGLTSQFLNHSVKVHAGALDREKVEGALNARLGDRATAALALAGTLPRLVYRMCEAEFGDVDAMMQELGTWAEGMFALWWARDPAEQAVLKKAVGGVEHAALTSREASDAMELYKRGLLVETTTGYALNGAAWEAYVRAR